MPHCICACHVGNEPKFWGGVYDALCADWYSLFATSQWTDLTRRYENPGRYLPKPQGSGKVLSQTLVFKCNGWKTVQK